MNETWLFIPLLAFLDRLYGGWPKVRIAGRGLNKIGALLIIPVGLFLGLSVALSVALAVAFVVWRTPAWEVLGGDLAPRRQHYLGTLARHCLAPLAFGAALYWLGSVPVHDMLWLLFFPPLATLLAIWNRHEANEGDDVNGQVEFIRGAILGCTLAVSL